MKEQLISLETAILAKEKGYNQNPYKTKNAYGPEYIDGSNIRLRSSSLFNPDSNTAVAPTQSLLQKWLREEHKIDIIIHVTSTTNEYWAHIPNFIRGDWKSICFKIYEEALEQGLIEGLNRI